MRCEPVREAISARLDGEAPGLPDEQLDGHLARCAACAAWADAAAGVTRRVRLAPARPVPDLTAAVLAALPRELPEASRQVRWTAILRLTLLVVGIAQAGLAWPALADGSLAMRAPVHLTHETVAWNLAVAAAFVAVAAAPRLAAGALPFLGTFALLLTAVTADDLVAGRVPLDRAVAHLLLLAGVALVAGVAWRTRRPVPAGVVGSERVVA